MGFRLAVIAAGAVESNAAAGELVAAMQRTPRGEPPGAIVEVLGALGGSPVGHYIERCRSDSRGALLSVDYPESGLLEALLMLAKDHDLAVYDILLGRLYDPTASAEVEVALPGVRIPFLTRRLLADLVANPQWPEPEAPYVIIDRSQQDFIQVWRLDDGTYRIEYRDGGPESHFLAHVDDAESTANVMWAWTIQDPSWLTALDWWFIDLDASAEPEPARRSGSIGHLVAADAAALGNGSCRGAGTQGDRPRCRP